MKEKKLKKPEKPKASRGAEFCTTLTALKRDGAQQGCIARFRGVTLLEMIVSISMFMLLMVAVFAIFNSFLKYWRAAEARDEVHRTFLRFSSNIDKELIKSDIETVRCGTDGDRGWIAFKTNIDSSGDPCCDNKGYPIWKRCIIYYTIRPEEDSCSTSGSGRDLICPHKFLIRKDIDDPNAINSDGDVEKYLTFTLTVNEAKSEGKILYVKPVVTNVLELHAHKDSTQVYVHLSVLRIAEAQRKLQIGVTSLDSDAAKPFINRFVWCTMPQNEEL